MKEVLLGAIKKGLESYPDVIFAYVFGSFLNSENFRDVDIGIYIKDTANPFAVSPELKNKFPEGLEVYGKFNADFFDVQILNYAPFYILGRIIREGILILDRNPEFRKNLVEKISLMYRECAGI